MTYKTFHYSTVPSLNIERRKKVVYTFESEEHAAAPDYYVKDLAENYCNKYGIDGIMTVKHFTLPYPYNSI